METALAVFEYIGYGVAALSSLGLLSAKFIPNTMMEMYLYKFWCWVFKKTPDPVENSIIGFLALNVKMATKAQKDTKGLNDKKL